MLSDASRDIKESGQEITSMEFEITKLQAKIAIIKRDMSIAEHDLLTQVKREWSNSEILEARTKAVEFNKINF